MTKQDRIIFAPFCLDLANECLWRGTQAIHLRPKAFAVLEYLLNRPGQLVTKEKLLDEVWPETFVGEAVLKVAIRQLREALADDPKSPRFIETAHRRGYRFIGQITDNKEPQAEEQESRSNPAVSISSLFANDTPQKIVGRDEAMRQMQGWFAKMLRGERQIVFVTGEAGIGKTTLVDTFVRGVAMESSIRISRGQCLEQYGTSEAYLPVLEAIGRLCREQSEALEVLRAHAPMWLLQFPSLVSVTEREALQRELLGSSHERMLREMGEALEVLTADAPLILILEDLHWSDYSTLDLISYLARQRQAARLMVIGTYRIAELIASRHPLKSVKRELVAKQQCEELPLCYLSSDAIARYLSMKFPGHRFPAELAAMIHARTDGIPLFMVNTIDYLVAERLLVKAEEGWELVAEVEKIEVGVPDSIKQMIEKQIDHLDMEDQRTLEVASITGATFSTLPVASGLEEDRAAVEARCEVLARQGQFIQGCGVKVLPNGEAVSRYAFIHALYQNVLYERVPAARRIQLHRRIGEQGEVVYGEQARDIAAELAMHFEQCRDYKRAAKYLQQAADNAIRRFAYREAVSLARWGLELLGKLPDSKERAEQELCLQLTLGVPLIATAGYAAEAVGSVYTRARELDQQLGGTPDIAEVLWGLWAFYILRVKLEKAHELAEELLSLADRLPYPGLRMRGHLAMEVVFLHLGEVVSAREQFEKALALYDPERHRDDAFFYAQHPGVAMRCHAAWALWLLGHADQAVAQIEEALTLARELREPHGLAHTYLFAAMLHQFRREARLEEEYAERAIAVTNEHGILMYHAHAMIVRGWALLDQGREAEAIEQIRQGIADHQATDTEVMRPHYLALLAQALGKTGQVKEGLLLLDEALVMAHRSGEGYYEAELYRLKGELLLMQTAAPGASLAARAEATVVGGKAAVVLQAENCFRKALEIAQRQQAKSLELRAGISLARLYQQQGKPADARNLLTPIYYSFTEGFDTADLQEAKALLDALT